LKHSSENDPIIRQAVHRLQSGKGKLVVIQTAFLGDVILVTPLLRAIRQAFPDAKLSVVVIPECSKVLHSQVDEIIIFNKRDKRKRKDQWHELIARLRSESFDAALIPHRSLRSGLTALKAGIPCRIGFKRGPGYIFHTHRIAYPTGVYEGIRNLLLLDSLSPRKDNGLPLLYPTDEDVERAEKLLSGSGINKDEYAVLAPGSVWASKRWSIDYYKELRLRLESEFSLPVIAIGGEADREECSIVVSTPERNLAGMLSPLGSAVILKYARLLVSGDTAPAHICTAMSTRQIIIFGSTAPRFGFAPPVPTARIVQFPLWCRPCSNHGRNFCPNLGRYNCLKNIKPDMVIETAGDWI